MYFSKLLMSIAWREPQDENLGILLTLKLQTLPQNLISVKTTCYGYLLIHNCTQLEVPAPLYVINVKISC